MKIYACYNVTGHLEDLEFWSINKRLYDEYLAIFGDSLDKGTFIHKTLPISMYPGFDSKYIDRKLKIFDDYPNTDVPFISTDSDLEIFDQDEILTDLLQLELVPMTIVKHLPSEIQAVIRKSNYSLYLGSRLTRKGGFEDKIDVVKLLVAFNTIRYSGEEIIDPNLYNEGNLNTRWYNRE
jgi:hypothetical protein